jgi:hypothetical protein
MAGAAECSLFQNIQTGFDAHPASYSKGARGFFPQMSSDLDMKFATDLHPVPRLGMTGTVLLLPQYVFRAWTWTSVTVALYSF